ncbi:MAG: hypothetical protein J6A42_05515 [Firmicutes bacterium]|nr:hypothetical protein [Bacillota bacterium]
MSENQKNEIKATDGNTVETVQDDYDLVIQPIEVPDSEWLSAHGYKRLAPEVAAHVSELFQGVPALVVNQATVSAANDATSKMAEGAYKAILKEGTHLAKSKVTEGTFRGTLLSNVNNQGFGQAEFAPLKPIELSCTPQVVLGAFTAISAVTGQFFLAEINNNLRSIEDGLDEIRNFLSSGERGKITAGETTVGSYIRDIQSINGNSQRKAAVITNLETLRTEALGYCNSYAERVQDIKSNLTKKGKKGSFKRAIVAAEQNLPLYWRAINLYGKASFLQAVLVEETSPNYLENLYADLSGLKHRYLKDYSICNDALQSSINNNLVYKISKHGAKLVSQTADISIMEAESVTGTIASGIFKGGALIIDSALQNSKKGHLEHVRGIFDICGNMGPIDATLEDICRYKEYQTEPISIIQTKDGAYIAYCREADDADELAAINKEKVKVPIK